MKKMRMFACLVITIMVISTCTIAQAQDAQTGTINISVDGEQVTFTDAKPIVSADGRTLTPVRFVAESLGATVGFFPENGTVVIVSDDATTQMILTIGSNVISVNKNQVHSTITMDTNAIIINERSYVPIRYVAEILGATVNFDAETNTVTIKSYECMLAETDYTEGGKYIALADYDKDACFDEENGMLYLFGSTSGQVRYATNGMFCRLGYWKVANGTVYLAVEHLKDF